MKQFDHYWKLWQSDSYILRKKIEEPFIVECVDVETKLIVGGGIITAFPFYQDEEEGWYAFVPPGFDGEMCSMWYDRENGVIYTVAVEGVVEVLASNISFARLSERPPHGSKRK